MTEENVIVTGGAGYIGSHACLALKRPGDCSKLVSGSSKALSDLEWEPKNSQLEKMVRDAWNWHKLEQYY
ncbi:hypothetical protein N9V66_03125 [Amylibacter sp.]|nr:hypothetical protein [Amylibacter sp.]